MRRTLDARNARLQRGFSLPELLVSLGIMLVMALALLTLFDRSSKMSKTETGITESQQNLRYAAYEIVREARMAGAGGLPASTSEGGTIRQLAVSLNLGSSQWGAAGELLVNNVNAASDVVFLGNAADGLHHVRRGTDLLHIRGVISTPVFDLTSSAWTPPASGTVGTLVIQPCTKFTDPAAVSSDPCYPNGANDMSIFASSDTFPRGRLFVVSDTFGNVGVGRVGDGTDDVATSTVTLPGGATGLQAVLKIDVGGATPDSSYWQTLSMGGSFPGITSPTRGGVLDDRVFFVDDGPSAGASCTSGNANASPGPCHPMLSMADWQEGDTASAPFSTARVTPIAEDIEDLQVAYGIDFYDLHTAGGSLANPAPAETDPSTGVARGYPSDGSISVASAPAFASVVAAARTSTSPDRDPSFSASADGDEWIWNVAGEPGAGTFDRTSDLSRLRALEIAIVAKGTQPDPKFSGPGAVAWPVLDGEAPSVSQLMSPVGTFHRRSTTVRVALRNFNVQ
jgi:prepilin-type N-terminal cleavage/methylation domain-containing protein